MISFGCSLRCKNHHSDYGVREHGLSLATELVRSGALFSGVSQTLPSSFVKWALEESSDCAILMRIKQNEEINNSVKVHRIGNSLFPVMGPTHVTWFILVRVVGWSINSHKWAIGQDAQHLESLQWMFASTSNVHILPQSWPIPRCDSRAHKPRHWLQRPLQQLV